VSSFRPGDRTVEIAGVATRLRLTVAALAEMADALEVDSPGAMATRLRTATPEDWNILLGCLASPKPETQLSAAQLAVILSEISAVIAEGLST